MTCKEKCICGTDPSKPWETKGYCDKQKLVNRIPSPPTCCEQAVSEQRARFDKDMAYMFANAPETYHEIKSKLYRA